MRYWRIGLHMSATPPWLWSRCAITFSDLRDLL